MNVLRACLLGVLIIVALAGSLAPVHATGPEDIQAFRNAAYAKLRAGDPMGGAMTLLEGFRNLPRNDPALVDPAIDPFHLLAFTVDFLLKPEDQTYFVDEELQFDSHDIDEFLKCVFWFNMGRLEPDEARYVRERLIGLSYRENEVVRAGALFFQADPYYFYDSNTAFLARTKLVHQFPDTELARVAVRMPVLNRRHGYEQALAAWNHEREREVVRERMLDDPVLQLLTSRLGALHTADEGAQRTEAASLLGQVRAHGDWMTRYSVLLMVEPVMRRGEAEGMRSQCEDWAQAAVPTPDAVLAHIALINHARAEDDIEALAHWGARLAVIEHADTPIERNIYEDIMKSALQAGDALAELGAHAEAIEVFTALGRKFPNSQLAVVCEERITGVHAQAADAPRP